MSHLQTHSGEESPQATGKHLVRFRALSFYQEPEANHLSLAHLETLTRTPSNSGSNTSTANGNGQKLAGPRLPQAIAHRGYKAAFPENSMGAFQGAVDVGAHAIETDLHLTKDGVVVLVHVCFLTSFSLPHFPSPTSSVRKVVRASVLTHVCSTGSVPQTMFWHR